MMSQNLNKIQTQELAKFKAMFEKIEEIISMLNSLNVGSFEYCIHEDNEYYCFYYDRIFHTDKPDEISFTIKVEYEDEGEIKEYVLIDCYPEDVSPRGYYIEIRMSNLLVDTVLKLLDETIHNIKTNLSED